MDNWSQKNWAGLTQGLKDLFAGHSLLEPCLQ